VKRHIAQQSERLKLICVLGFTSGWPRLGTVAARSSGNAESWEDPAGQHNPGNDEQRDPKPIRHTPYAPTAISVRQKEPAIKANSEDLSAGPAKLM
jgi:hypothetical protein